MTETMWRTYSATAFIRLVFWECSSSSSRVYGSVAAWTPREPNGHSAFGLFPRIGSATSSFHSVSIQQMRSQSSMAIVSYLGLYIYENVETPTGRYDTSHQTPAPGHVPHAHKQPRRTHQRVVYDRRPHQGRLSTSQQPLLISAL